MIKISKENSQKILSSVLRNGLLPSFLYFVLFCILTFPLIFKFSTHFFTHPYLDGLQNVWNIWWVNKSVTELHQLPWHTQYLHYPYGVSLLGHTLNPFNGFLGIFLLKCLSLVQTFNFLVIFSFVIGGLNAFLLAYYFSKSYWGSIVAGFIFSFSSYHFIHLVAGHLQLISLEWIPLFVLCAYILITKPRIKIALITGLLLFLVILCDYYYFFYCVVLFIFMVIWYAIKKRKIFFLQRDYLAAFFSFVITVLLTSGPLIVSLLMLNKNDPLIGSHDSITFSADLFAPFIHGEFWRFANFTKFYWSRLQCYFGECSVYLGVSVIFVLIYVWIKRKTIESEILRFWYFVILFFYIMSLGPFLHVFGGVLPFVKMPYELLCILLPYLRLSGVPVRMMIIVYLGAGVIFALGFRYLFNKSKYQKLLVGLLVAVLFFEYVPKKIPAVRIDSPKYLKILKNLPGEDGVFDMVNKEVFALYFQTIHEKPMAFGYVSRIPKSVNEQDDDLTQAILENDFSSIYNDYRIRYIIAPSNLKIENRDLSIGIHYEDEFVVLYDLDFQG